MPVGRRKAAVAAGADIDLDSPRNREIAREIARSSVTLLANDGVLPIAAPRRIAVVGPCADDPQAFMGCYSYPNHVLVDHPELGLGVAADSLFTALRQGVPRRRADAARGLPRPR